MHEDVREEGRGSSHACGAPYFRAIMASGQQQVNVADLDLPQLADVRRQLEEVHLLYPKPIILEINVYTPQELQHLSNSFTQLKAAQAKFKACIENVREINPANKGKSFHTLHRKR